MFKILDVYRYGVYRCLAHYAVTSNYMYVIQPLALHYGDTFLFSLRHCFWNNLLWIQNHELYFWYFPSRHSPQEKTMYAVIHAEDLPISYYTYILAITSQKPGIACEPYYKLIIYKFSDLSVANFID